MLLISAPIEQVSGSTFGIVFNTAGARPAKALSARCAIVVMARPPLLLLRAASPGGAQCDDTNLVEKAPPGLTYWDN